MEDNMDRVKELLELSKEDSEIVSKISFHPHQPHIEPSFYQRFAFRGIRVDTVQPGLLVCSFTVPPHLTDKSGNLATGAIANLVDGLGASVIYKEGLPVSVSVTISISYLSTAKLNDELEITSKLLGQKGFISGTVVSIENKATREVIAEGRHTLFSKPTSKI